MHTLLSTSQITIDIDSLFDGPYFYLPHLCAFRGALPGPLLFHPQGCREGPPRRKDSRAQVREIVVIGGSTRMPRMAKFVSDLSMARSPTS